MNLPGGIELNKDVLARVQYNGVKVRGSKIYYSTRSLLDPTGETYWFESSFTMGEQAMDR